MEAVFVYLLKMMIGSAALFGYYRVALYNEAFHQWNRFFLLGAFVLSVVVPFITIPVMAYPNDHTVVTAIASLPWNVKPTSIQKDFEVDDYLTVIALIVTIFSIARMVVGVIKIVTTYLGNTKQTIPHNVHVVMTDLCNAPFSFFSWLFWRKDLNPASDNGQRMLRHELVHIEQFHSIDKIFTSLLLCFFWMNPFFWLMRKELYIIHEFLADQQAIEQHNGEAFAEMILLAIPFKNDNNNELVNPFFSSQIKRRLLMITTSKNSKYAYLRRITGLALIVFSSIGLTMSVQSANAQQKVKQRVLTESVNADTVQPVKVAKEVNTPKIKKVIISETNPATKQSGAIETRVVIRSTVENQQSTKSSSPIYFIDGIEADAGEIESLPADKIKEVNVFKGEHALEKYGEKSKNGVVEIKMKSNFDASAHKQNIVLKATKNATSKHLSYVDGKLIDAEDVEKIDPNNIESISVLKGESATKKYGDKGKHGVVEISLKNIVL